MIFWGPVGIDYVHELLQFLVEILMLKVKYGVNKNYYNIQN